MKLGEHSPGPWIREVRTVYALNIENTNRFWVQVQTGNDDNGQRTHPRELEANASLIAAAPDLLAVLEEILSRFDDDDLKLTVDAIQASRGVIKKAKSL